MLLHLCLLNILSRNITEISEIAIIVTIRVILNFNTFLQEVQHLSVQGLNTLEECMQHFILTKTLNDIQTSSKQYYIRHVL